MSNIDYYKRREENQANAEKIVNWLNKNYRQYIDSMVSKMVLFPERKAINVVRERFTKTEVLVKRCSTVDAIIEENSKENGHVVALNFASYKNPGGQFINGSMAQEESLCHASMLYPVLNSTRANDLFYGPHKTRLNRALYHSDLLYIKDVPFWSNQQKSFASIITCAAPNKNAAKKYCNVSDEECKKVMDNRIESVLAAAYEMNDETLILGAFGTGVFGNDVEEVAELFNQAINGKFKNAFKEIIFAVIDQESYIKMANIIDTTK